MLVLVWSLTALSTALLVVALLWSWRGRYLLLLEGAAVWDRRLGRPGKHRFPECLVCACLCLCAGVVSTPVDRMQMKYRFFFE